MSESSLQIITEGVSTPFGCSHEIISMMSMKDCYFACNKSIFKVLYFKFVTSAISSSHH